MGGGGGTQTAGGAGGAGGMGLYEPSYDYGGSSGFNWGGALATGAQKFGQGISSGAAPIKPPQVTGIQGVPELSIYQSQQAPPIASGGGGGGTDIVSLLRQLGIQI